MIFSKIEAGRLEIEKIPVRPAELINDVIGLFWERASSTGVDLTSYVGPGVPEVISGDPVRLNQILSNLVNNALKFTAEGSVIVTVKRLPSTTNECIVEFSVSDTGVGIPYEKQKYVFEAFSQVDQTTTRKFGGTGLGLAICQKLVERMDGEIGVTSRQAKGSRFFFSLPTEIVEDSKQAIEAPREKTAIVSVPGRASAVMISRYLEEVGITAQIVEHESMGAMAAKVAYADIIFASSEFLEAFDQAVQGNPEYWVPTRICVSELGEAVPDRLLEAGIAEDLLIKPFSRVDVMEQIRRVLEGRLRGRNAVRGEASMDTVLPVFAGQRVLAADDSPVNREVVKEALTRLGLVPTVVNDGLQAVEAVQTGDFDLVLMDCSMPVMDGFAATRAIRKYEIAEGLSRLPILALTAHVSGPEEEWRDVGMDDYLTKPFTISILANAMGTYFAPDPNAQKEIEEIRASEGAQEPMEKEETANAPTSAFDKLRNIEIAKESDAYMENPTQNAQPIDNATEDEKAIAQNDAFDYTTLGQLAEMDAGSGDLIHRAIGLFEEHSKPAIVRIAKAIQIGETDEIKSAAHALKSMSLNIGARSLADVCAAIETEAAAGQPVADKMKLLRDAFTRTHKGLPDIRNRFEKPAA